MTARLGDVDTICAIVGGIVALSAPEMIRAACPNLSTRSRDMNVGGAWSSMSGQRPRSGHTRDSSLPC